MVYNTYLLSDYPNNFLAVNLPGNSSLLNVLSSLFCFLMFSISCQYFFSNSLTASFAFSKFSFSSQVSNSAVNPFYHTKYLFFSLICYLFRILSTFHFSSPLITTRVGYFLLCSSIWPIYYYILLTLTTEYILIVASSSNSTIFGNTILLIL